MAELELIVYSAALCGDCQLLKAFLDERGIPYKNRDIRQYPEYGRELESRTGKLGVPYIVHHGEWKRAYQPGEPFSAEFAEQLLGLR